MIRISKNIGFLLILLLFRLHPAQTQVILDTTYFDNQWNQSGPENASFYRIIKSGTEAETFFLVEDYYITGKLQMSGSYKSISPDNRHGKFIYYFKNGKKNQECTFSNNELQGLFQTWYPTGQISVKAEYVRGKPNDEYEEWYSNGSKKITIDYTNGMRNGRFFTYYENGKPARYDFYLNDKLSQKQCFTPNGEKSEYFLYLEDAEFIGGIKKFKKYINDSLQYPQVAKDKKIQGQVLLEFEVLENGSVGQVNILQSTNKIFDNEAKRLIRNSPKWKPAKLDGIPVKLSYRIPILFNL